eukprot:g4082.t1
MRQQLITTLLLLLQCTSSQAFGALKKPGRGFGIGEFTRVARTRRDRFVKRTHAKQQVQINNLVAPNVGIKLVRSRWTKEQKLAEQEKKNRARELANSETQCPPGYGLAPTYFRKFGNLCTGAFRIQSYAECKAAATRNKLSFGGESNYGPYGCSLRRDKQEVLWNSKSRRGERCTGTFRVDHDTVGVHYIEDDISHTYKNYMINLKNSLRYDVHDASCPSAPLFDAKDISIQEVSMGMVGSEKEWVSVVKLNTNDKNGYLQNELPYCMVKDYLITTRVEVKAYVDRTGCCNDLKDYKTCDAKFSCKGQLIKLKDQANNHFSKDISLVGTHYTVKNLHPESRRKRRSLLQNDQLGDNS